jgi:hypothetical protein
MIYEAAEQRVARYSCQNNKYNKLLSTAQQSNNGELMQQGSIRDYFPFCTTTFIVVS